MGLFRCIRFCCVFARSDMRLANLARGTRSAGPHFSHDEKWGKESPKEGPSPSLWNPPRWCWVAVRQISPGPGSLLLFLKMPPHRATMAAGPSGQVVSLSGPFLGAATVPSRRNPGFRQPRTAATLRTKALEGRQRTACLAVYNARSNCFPGLARNQGRP